jgi:hypothetical protein
LFQLYRKRGRPCSLAVKTDQPTGDADLQLLADIRGAGGSILSHSVTHAPNWGGSAEAAEAEARGSKAWLETCIPAMTVRYAVSPFHQNPIYVPRALAAAGYDGFVGGSISSDPEYLMARGGVPPYAQDGFISHSQSCMLHGDCLLAGDEPLRIYHQAFRMARMSGQFFAYLDHPFSQRYSYGWANEPERMRTHEKFLDFMESDCAEVGPLLCVNEDTCLDFIRGKAAIEIVYDPARQLFDISRQCVAGLPLSIGYHGKRQAAGDG